MKTTHFRNISSTILGLTGFATVMVLSPNMDSASKSGTFNLGFSAAEANPFQKFYDNTVKKAGRATGLNNVAREVEKGVRNTGRGIRNIPNDLRRPHRIPGNIVRESRAGLRNLDRERRRWQAKAGRDVLANWIRASRRDAIRAGVSPIPPRIFRKLSRFFDPGLLRSVRFRVGRGHFLSLQNLSISYGHAAAITLGDVIVFKNRTAAMNDVLWVHEIQHVLQYKRWGLRKFAYHYIDDHGRVEREARSVENRYHASVRQYQAPPRREVRRRHIDRRDTRHRYVQPRRNVRQARGNAYPRTRHQHAPRRYVVQTIYGPRVIYR